MVRLIKAILILFVVVATASARAKKSESPSLLISVSLDKIHFHSGELIKAHVVLANIGKLPALVRLPLIPPHNIQLVVEHRNGKEARRCAWINDFAPTNHPYIQIEPGKSLTVEATVTCSKRQENLGYVLHQPGKYRIRASYHPDVEFPDASEVDPSEILHDNVIQGQIDSPWVAFWIAQAKATK